MGVRETGFSRLPEAFCCATIALRASIDDEEAVDPAGFSVVLWDIVRRLRLDVK
jgi:hypothetical protein